MASSTGTDGTPAARGSGVFTKSAVLLYTYYFIHIFTDKKKLVIHFCEWYSDLLLDYLNTLSKTTKKESNAYCAARSCQP